MIKNTSRLFITAMLAAGALQVGCTQPPDVGSATEALETAQAVDFNDLQDLVAVAGNHYAAQGLHLGLAGDPGLLRGYLFGGAMTLAVNTDPGFGQTVLVATFHDPADGSPTTASNVVVDVFDTEGSVQIRSYGAGNNLLLNTAVGGPGVALGNGVARFEIDDVGGDGFAIDNLTYTLHTADTETCAARLAAQCPPGFPWKNHGQYVSCVAHVSRTCVQDGLATQAERSAFIQAAAQSDIGK